jgi:glycosyltransferase involved in cell wall biosynthesis
MARSRSGEVRILLVAPYFKDSFAGKISMGSAVRAAEELSRRHQVLVITTGRDQAREEVSPRLTVLSAPAFLLPDPVNYVVSPASLRMVRRAIRELQPDLVIVNKFMFFTSFAAPLAKWMGCKTVVVTDTYPGINWFPRNRLVGWIMWLYARLVGVPILRSADKVVLLHEGLSEIARTYRFDSVVIHNGPDLDAAAAARPADDLGVKPEGEIWIGYLGRLESVKGYDFLMRAVEMLSSRRKGLKAFFIGAQRPRAVRQSESFEFLGFREDVFSVLKRMDLFCLPSLSEGLPNALMEAMAVACPVIASGVGGVEVLIEDGVNGVLVPPGDVEALARAIDALIDDPERRRALGARARESIESRFNWERIGDEYERLFDSLLGRSDLRSQDRLLPDPSYPLVSSVPRVREDA